MKPMGLRFAATGFHTILKPGWLLTLPGIKPTALITAPITTQKTTPITAVIGVRTALIAALLTAAVFTTLSGCAVREQAFGCEGLAGATASDEFVMTPTSLRFQSVSYRFTEERSSLRIYTHPESGRNIQFNPASGLLEQESFQWQCKRIGIE
jgi:hypothetical protein